MAKGWIKLHRQIADNELWNDKPFAKGQAWIDLLLMANHEDNGQYKAGCVYTSYEILAKRWGWSRNKVRRFLGTLTNLQMTTVNGTPNGTVLTLVKYEDFQSQRHTKWHTKRHTDEPTNELLTRRKEYIEKLPPKTVAEENNPNQPTEVWLDPDDAYAEYLRWKEENGDGKSTL